MNKIKKLVAVALSAVTVASVGVVGSTTSAGASGTGAGLAEYALNAYYSGWSYVWGGSEPGAVDCSGLIWSYCGGDRCSMLSDAQANGRDWGYVSSGVPRVHGLGLSRPNHVGVYIEDGMEVDARGSDYGVCYQAIGENGWNNWDCWFKLTAVTYPENGWENFNGNYYYYEDGEYIVDTTRTIDGTTYYFDSKGHSSTAPSGSSSGGLSGSTSGNSGSSGSSSNTSSSSGSASKPTSWSKGSNDDEVVKIQTRLAELGYYDGPIDGDFGDMTDAAFRAFQKAAGLTVDGIAGSDREVLYSENAPSAKKETEEQPATEAASTEETAQPADENAQTEEKSEEDLNFIVIDTGSFSDEVAQVQSQLKQLGYFNLEPTGLFGDFTTAAITSFQSANGLEATGQLDTKTYMLLFSDEAAAAEVPAAAEEEKTEEAAGAEAAEENTSALADVMDAVAAPVVDNSADISSSLISSNDDASAPVAASESASNASDTVAKANEVTAKALEKSSKIVPAASTADVKRTANIWLWLILVAAILGIVAFVLLKHNKSKTRYQRYVEKKKKMSTRAQLNTRW